MSPSRTCSSNESAVAGAGDSGVGEFMLFGVRVVVDSMRKSVSLNNLSQYEQPHEAASGSNNIGGKDDVAAGYASENDVVHNSGGNRERERKRGIPWTEEEHKLFLRGLELVGKGDWRGISRNFVKTRTPTQVASHAQKYFLRRNNFNRRRRRSSLFDITTETVSAIPMEEGQVHDVNANASQSHPLAPLQPEPCNPTGFSLVPTCPVTSSPTVVPVLFDNPIDNLTLSQANLQNKSNASSNLIRPIALHSVQPPHGTRIPDLDLDMNSPMVSLNLSLQTESRQSPARHSAFQSMSSFNNGDSIITVA
ncbi:hypothetical protein UlMin_008103 [Ulmus minor]